MIPDFEWLMIDASYIKAHPHSAGARGGKPGHCPHKRGLNSKLHPGLRRGRLWQWTLTECR